MSKANYQSGKKQAIAAKPQFGEPQPTTDPTKFKVTHSSDTQHYNLMQKQVQPIPKPADPKNMVLQLDTVYSGAGADLIKNIKSAGKIVFHMGGDTGPTVGPKTIEAVVDKMIMDFEGEPNGETPSFFFHLGDVVYSFGESIYYYDQFFEPFRDYPAPILAIPGNHDGLSYKGDREPYMAAFLRNFVSPEPTQSPDAGALVRTTVSQPGVYFALEAPFVTILGLYSNILEDPGVISSEGGKLPITDEQLDFLKTQLARLKNSGQAIIIAVHHPPFVYGGSHGGSPTLLADLDACCKHAGVWPHAVISGHSHNYQRFSRTINGHEIPYIVCGNSGHNLSQLKTKNATAIRAPQKINDTLIFENYDDKNYGYLRVVCDGKMLRVEYHDAQPDEKTYSDAVTVDLKLHTIEAN